MEVIGLDESEKAFNELYAVAKKDPNVLGFILVGSRGKGLVTKHSDYDVCVVVKDDVVEFYETKLGADAWVFSLSGFEEHAAFGSEYEWLRYDFMHLKVLIDRNGRIQRLVDNKGRIPKDQLQDYVSDKLDAYINAVYRSLKGFRDGHHVGARLNAAKSIHFFLNVIFGLEGRITPYYKYLEWELKTYPLAKCPMKPNEIITSLLTILETADIQTQQRLFRATERVCRDEGYRERTPGSVKWISTFKHNRT